MDEHLLRLMNTSLRIKEELEGKIKKIMKDTSKIVSSRNPSQAVPVPKQVSELELEVMFSCPVRQSRVLMEGIGSLQANLRDSESRIKGMYKELSM